MGELARLEVSDGVGTIRLDRPKMNAINAQMQDELTIVAQEADARDDVAAVVVFGGERVFAAGADVKEMATMSYADMARRAHVLQQFTRDIAAIGKPTISAITGFALGGGCELALATDVRFAADNAKLGQPEILLGIIPGAGGTQRLSRLIGPARAKDLIFTGRFVDAQEALATVLRFAADNAKLGQPEMLLGIIPGAGGTQRLSRLVGPARAKDLIFTGRFVDAQEALAIGLVDQLHPAADVYAKAVEWATQFVGGPALALRAAKSAIDRGLEVDLQTGLDIERVEFAGLFATDDRTAGMDSFVENGPGKATFTGS